MKKFGFSKKDKSASGGMDAEETSTRSALFGSRSSKASAQTPPQSNPYAQPPSSNPYAQAPPSNDPYAVDSNKYSNVGKPYADRGNPYGGGADSSASHSGGGYGYGSSGGAYGGSSGYGGDQYGGGGSGSRGPGGYGGLGRTNSNTTDDNRAALFGGAQERYDARGPPQQQQGGYGSQVPEERSGYGAYGEERQLTAEEQEEEDVEADKQQIRFMKREDVASTQRALQIAAQAEESGRQTLERLGQQGERLHNTEANLDLAASHNRVAEERARELKTLNGSMFAVHVSNPFTKGSRKAARDEEILNRHQAERDRREKSRQEAYGSKQRMDGAMRDNEGGAPGSNRPRKKNLAERSKYQFEADSEDEALEDQIDENLDALSGAAGRLNKLSRAMGDEVEHQNKHLDRIAPKIDDVDDKLAMNRARLNRIH